ncbi:cell surface A33 antigen-like [Anableps anableps]
MERCEEVWSAVAAINVNIPKDQYEFSRGDNIILPCTFTSTQRNPSLVIISWSGEGPNTSPDETLILTHYHPGGETDVTSKYEGRVSVDVSTATGKANLKLSSITMEDNKEFECRVQIPGDDEGKPADFATLTKLNLSVSGESRTRGLVVRDIAEDPRTTDKDGILSLYHFSRDTSGFYICTSHSKIQLVTCIITLSVMPPSSWKLDFFIEYPCHIIYCWDVRTSRNLHGGWDKSVTYRPGCVMIGREGRQSSRGSGCAQRVHHY